MAFEPANAQILESAIAQIIRQFDDLNREGLRETPARVARMYQELLSPAPLDEITVFEANGYDEMIVDNGIKFYSLCEHHLLPFFGEVAIGYIPNQKIIGLSKFSRIVEFYSRRLQMQERLTADIAQFLNEAIQPLGVGVIVKARHLCREMRGAKNSGLMITSSLLGVMRSNPATRAEFMKLISPQ